MFNSDQQVTNNASQDLTMLNQNQRLYSRQEAMELLEIRSRTTLTDYCNKLGFPAGQHYFNEEEFAELKDLRDWCGQGRRKADYFRLKKKATPPNLSTRKSLQYISAWPERNLNAATGGKHHANVVENKGGRFSL